MQVLSNLHEWASTPVLVRKRYGGVRWCIDHCALNSRSVMDVFPLPLIEEGMDTLGGNIWDFKLDANFLYFAFLIQSLKIGEYPEEWTLFSSSLETKFYWVNREAFLMNSEGGSVREKTRIQGGWWYSHPVEQRFYNYLMTTQRQGIRGPAHIAWSNWKDLGAVKNTSMYIVICNMSM